MGEEDEQVTGGVFSETVLVAVGSSNPCKIDAVRDALETLLNRDNRCCSERIKFEVSGLSVDSGVSHQPMGDNVTRLGAKNRAKAAYELFYQRNSCYPDLAVGLEGGLEAIGESKDELWCMAWMAVYGMKNNQKVLRALSVQQLESSTVEEERERLSCGLGKSGAFLLPPKVTRLIQQKGMELGDADDQIFGRIKSKHGGGTVGLVTDGVIDRAHYYQHALILALVPWIRPDAY